MIRLSTGWYVTLADLALILFMVTAQAVHEGEVRATPAVPPPATNPLPAEGIPLAVYRPGNAAPPLRQWLATAGNDPRARLTIVARHSGKDAGPAARRAAALAASAGTARSPRLIVEQGDRDEVLAVLSYDQQPASWHGDCKAGASKENPACD